MTKKFFYCCLLLISLLVVNSCTQLQVDPIAEDDTALDDTDPVVKRILDLGFDKDDIEDIGQYYLVDGDIQFDKFDGKEEPGNEKPQQQRTNELVSFYLQPMITVRIDDSMPTSGDDNWRPQIRQAISDWNSISNTRLNMILVDQATQVDITISSDTFSAAVTPLPDGAIASATFPSTSGRTGLRIMVNLDFNSNAQVTTGQKRRNMVHELGHCIGLMHTNEGNGITISGTPTRDDNSVMNGGTALNEWIGFSSYDQTAIRNLYPEDINAERVFELTFYSQSNPDVNNYYNGHADNIRKHWRDTGIDEGRIASPIFEIKYYLSKHSDVAQAFGSSNYRAALNHWLLNGITEGRQGSPAFNPVIYLQRNSDIAAAFGANNYQAALHHWLFTGIYEGREASTDFDVHVYLNKYSDIQAAYGTDYNSATRHYLLYGRYEGRTAPNP